MSDIETWAVLASGPSMSQEIADSVRGLRVIAVSNTYELAPWAEIRVSNDRTWWTNNPKALDFEGEKFCGLCIETPKTVTKFPGAISGGNSGLLALQVAVSKGAKRILLFGVDLCGSHYFGDHPSPLRNPSEKRFETFQKQFAFFRPAGVEIINCSPESKLRAYPFGNAKELIPQPEPEPEPAPAPLPEKGEMGPPGPMGPQGERGPRGPQGEQGPIGPMPDHQWQGTSLRFEEPDGGWGPYVDLRGPAGAQGYPGGGGGGTGQGMTPEQALQLQTLLNIFGGWISTVPVAVIDEVTIDDLYVTVEGSATGFYPTYPPASAGFVGQAWEWDWGDGSSVSTMQNASHTYATDGTYTISFRAKNHIGWSAPVTEDVTVTSGGGVFTPADLFSGGQVGAWYDPSDISTLFQDSARTVPVTTAGQTVAGVTDKSGNGFHLSNNTGTVTYQVDGLGNGYLNFNGSSSLRRSGLALTGSVLAIAHAINQLSNPGATNYWTYFGNSSALAIGGIYNAADGFFGQYVDGGAGSFDINTSNAGIDYSVGHVFSARSSSGKMNLDDATATGTGGSVTLANLTTFTIGCVITDGGPFGFSTGHYYGSVIRFTEWNDTEDAQLQDWLASRFA